MPVSIFDGGAIIGTGGTAIEFAGSGNTLTLGAGYTISGTVDPSGNNTFQLGGSGSDTFDLELDRGPIPRLHHLQRGRRHLDGHQRQHRPLDHQERRHLEVASGGELTSTTVSSGGVLVLESGGTAEQQLRQGRRHGNHRVRAP